MPVWVDAAQAVGHVASRVGATAVYGTSRKWLRGPDGQQELLGMVLILPDSNRSGTNLGVSRLIR